MKSSLYIFDPLLIAWLKAAAFWLTVSSNESLPCSIRPALCDFGRGSGNSGLLQHLPGSTLLETVQSFGVICLE
jgi:hypothetical protein